MDEKEIRDDRTPDNLSQSVCNNCSYPYDQCDCEGIMDKEIPKCCGSPVEIFQMIKTGEGEWVCHCKNCWDGTTPQQTRDAAIEAWERECV